MRGIALACVVAMGCANNVPQDRSTGPDGRVKGAKPIVLTNGEAAVKGIVTYPGGDRVDWRSIELPAGKRGRLDLQMKWVTPRPGLQLAFDVFDAWNNPIAVAKGSKGRTRETSIADATGKYFVRIYAKNRGDAGQYRFAVAFHEEALSKPSDPFAMEIPDPPRLAAVPGMPCETFDPKDPECKNVCPPTNPPPNWAACPATATPPPPTTVTPPPPVPPPPPPAKPITARVIKVDVNNGNVIVTIGAGSEHGVDKNWQGTILRGDTKNPLQGGKLQIIRVDKLRTYAKVTVTTDMVNENPIILLQP